MFAEKNLEVSIHKTESLSEMKNLEKDERQESGQEEEDKSKRPPSQSPQRNRQLDICESESSLMHFTACEIMRNSVCVCVFATARCQISEESKDEEVQRKEKNVKKSNQEDKSTPSLASLNSNYKDSSLSSSDSNEGVSHH